MAKAPSRQWRPMEHRIMPDAGLVGWMHKYARKHFWAVQGLMDLDDLVQDGYVCFIRTVNLYGVNLDPKHFMSLFKAVFATHIVDLSNLRTKRRTNEVTEADMPRSAEDEESEQSPLDRLIADEECDMSGVRQVVADAPSPAIAAVLALFLGEGPVDKLGKPYRQRIQGGRETTNEYLCRILGLNANIEGDLLGRVKSYLQSSQRKA